MKKSNYIIIIMLELVVILILIFLLKNNHSQSIFSSSDPEIVNEISLSSAYDLNTAEGDEDLDYNYITNPELLSQYNFLGIGITTYGDKVNDYVKSLGYCSQELYIVSIDADSSYIITQIKIGDSNNIFEVKYDNLLNEFFFNESEK